ncbi:MAG: class I SAM-dependent RNA methyltransferase, partial [bacterium]
METINIDSLAYGGYGVGRINSKVVFVNYAVPGDILGIEIFDSRKNYAFGRIIEIITPSPKRIAPACKHFGICGGCNYLNMPYEEEIYWKKEIFKTEFKKIPANTPGNMAAVKDADLIYNFETDNYLNYRQKIGLKIYPPYIGFYKKLSHNVVDIDYCHLASAGINELLKNVRNLLLSKNYRDTVLNKLTAVTLSDAGLRNIIFEFKNSLKNNILKYFAEDAINNAGADNVFFKFPAQKIVKYSGIRKNNAQIPPSTPYSDNYFTLKDKKFSYDLPSFIQINKSQNENIINIITDYAKNIIENRG